MSKDLPIILSVDQAAPQWLKGDPLRLRQILRNLVNNAVKYTRSGKIDIDVSAVPDHGREDCPGDSGGTGGPGKVRLLFTVSDTGIGIPESEQPSVFDSFTQVDSGLSKHHAGTGLGLAICKKLSELMGGAMWFESEEGKGSAFHLAVSFEIADQCGREDITGRTSGPGNDELGKLSILLVEDNLINQMFAVDLLESRGHRVAVAENGQKAIEALRKEAFDVTLMDIQMPVMNGLEATRAIRSHDGSEFDPDAPIIGLSAFAMDQDRKRFLAAGMDGYITKPIDIEEFFEVVGRTLGKKGGTTKRVCVSEDKDGSGPLDTAALYVQYRNKRELLGKVGREFVNRVPEYVRDMQNALAARDGETLSRLAHSIKGNASLFGAYGLRSLAAEVERLTGRNSWDALDEVLKSLIKESEEVISALEDFVERLG